MWTHWRHPPYEASDHSSWPNYRHSNNARSSHGNTDKFLSRLTKLLLVVVVVILILLNLCIVPTHPHTPSLWKTTAIMQVGFEDFASMVSMSVRNGRFDEMAPHVISRDRSYSFLNWLSLSDRDLCRSSAWTRWMAQAMSLWVSKMISPMGKWKFQEALWIDLILLAVSVPPPLSTLHLVLVLPLAMFSHTHTRVPPNTFEI